jgi:hypothetical protein
MWQLECVPSTRPARALQALCAEKHYPDMQEAWASGGPGLLRRRRQPMLPPAYGNAKNLSRTDTSLVSLKTLSSITVSMYVPAAPVPGLRVTDSALVMVPV